MNDYRNNLKVSCPAAQPVRFPFASPAAATSLAGFASNAAFAATPDPTHTAHAAHAPTTFPVGATFTLLPGDLYPSGKSSCFGCQQRTDDPCYLVCDKLMLLRTPLQFSGERSPDQTGYPKNGKSRLPMGAGANPAVGFDASRAGKTTERTGHTDASFSRPRKPAVRGFLAAAGFSYIVRYADNVFAYLWPSRDIPKNRIGASFWFHLRRPLKFMARMLRAAFDRLASLTSARQLFRRCVSGGTTTRPARSSLLAQDGIDGSGCCGTEATARVRYLDLSPIEMTRWLECQLAGNDAGAARVLDQAAHRINALS